MRYWLRKTLKYGGMIGLAILIYGSVTLLWSIVVPWKNYQWNNNAIHSNGAIMQYEIREFPSQNGNLYAGYILVKYDNYWSQLCAVVDTPSYLGVKQILLEDYPINSNVIIYYQSSSPSDPHLGPKPILDFLVWSVFNVVLFMGLLTTALVLIYRDYKNTFHAAENIPLYTQDAIKSNTHLPQYYQGQDVKLNNHIPSSYNL